MERYGRQDGTTRRSQLPPTIGSALRGYAHGGRATDRDDQGDLYAGMEGCIRCWHAGWVRERPGSPSNCPRVLAELKRRSAEELADLPPLKAKVLLELAGKGSNNPLSCKTRSTFLFEVIHEYLNSAPPGARTVPSLASIVTVPADSAGEVAMISVLDTIV